ncbi:MAG: class I SAM-dependent methyltransferase [Acidobacteria bacterium]|nr:class I SAM-dependent methyltransferase [Acidobacteriota bacterium]
MINSQSSNSTEFKLERLLVLSQIERWHFWFIGRQKLIKQLLNKHLKKGSLVLDLGCGTGFMCETLIEQGYKVIGLDKRPEGIKLAQEKFPQAVFLQADATNIPLEENTIDLVLLLDVLEHVDDKALLQEIFRVLKPNGLALITVPAMQWLWSYRDENAGHLRRYSFKNLKDVLKSANFQMEETNYYQFFLFPMILITRLFGRKKSTMRDLEEKPFFIFNTLMCWVNKTEAYLSQFISWPFGSSLITISRKIVPFK